MINLFIGHLSTDLNTDQRLHRSLRLNVAWTEESLFVFAGVVVQPGQQSLKIGIVGHGGDSWVIIDVDFKHVVPNACNPDTDYEQWDEHAACYLGKKVTYDRVKKSSWWVSVSMCVAKQYHISCGDIYYDLCLLISYQFLSHAGFWVGLVWYVVSKHMCYNLTYKLLMTTIWCFLSAGLSQWVLFFNWPHGHIKLCCHWFSKKPADWEISRFMRTWGSFQIWTVAVHVFLNPK